MNLRNLFLVILYFIVRNTDVCHSDTDATRLADKLLTNYKSYVRPLCGDNNTISVRLDVALRQIIDLDEPTQILKLNLWMRLKWTDCQLAWNASEYGNLSSLVVPFKYVWVPDLVLYDSTSDGFPGYSDYKPVIYSDGTINYNFPTIIESTCIVNVRQFPYDEQKCPLKFGSWSHHGNQLDLVYKNAYGDLSSAGENVEWDVSLFSAERSVVYYGCCPEPYPDVTFYLHLQRKPLFYVVNIIIPTFLITVIAILGFILPADAGEKVGLEITVMLALAVFQLLVADSLPPSAKDTPLIAIYFNFCLFLVGFAVIMAVISLNLYYKGDQQMPNWVIKVFLKYLNRAFFVTVPEFGNNDNEKDARTQESNIQQNETTDIVTVHNNGKVGRNSVTPVSGSKLMTEDKADREATKGQSVLLTTEEHWKVLSQLIDRISCAIFVLVGVIGTIVVFRQFQ